MFRRAAQRRISGLLEHTERRRRVEVDELEIETLADGVRRRQGLIAGGKLEHEGKAVRGLAVQPRLLRTELLFLDLPLSEHEPDIAHALALTKLLVVLSPADERAYLAERTHTPRKAGRLRIHEARRHLRPEGSRLSTHGREALTHDVVEPRFELIEPRGDALLALLDASGFRFRIGRSGGLVLPGLLRLGAPRTICRPFGDKSWRLGARDRFSAGQQEQQTKDVLAGYLAAGAATLIGDVLEVDPDLVWIRTACMSEP